MLTYSIVVPVYNEENVLNEFYRRTVIVCDAIAQSCEIVFVNDGSTDGSLRILERLRAHDKRVKIVNLSRNFGHQSAITCGIDHASGQAIVIIDADLQDPPELIPQLMEQWRAGYSVVYAQRTKRRDESIVKATLARVFYRLLRRVAPNEGIPEDVGDFRLIDRKVARVIKEMRESHRFMRGLISWVGFRQTGVGFVREGRYAGETKYPFWKSLSLAVDGLTSFSTMPLRLATYLGFLTVVVTFCVAILVLVSHFGYRATVQGWTSVMIALLFIGGIQLVVIGVLGEYVGRIYEDIKHRPLYVVESARGFDDVTGERHVAVRHGLVDDPVP
jgi:dolichol-phosphate mannosyltransferase